MSPLDYISIILSKMRNKKYEYYVLSRFWHRLDDLTIEIKPQQYISRKNGFALADLYLPQFNLVIEVDEKYHLSTETLSKDEIREKDIISAIDATIFRIPIYMQTGKKEQISIQKVNERIDDLIKEIKLKKKKMTNFEDWDMNKKSDTNYYIAKKSITLSDGCAFRKIIDALNCFGKQYKGLQQGGVKHSQKENTAIWFPKLYENSSWDNSLNPEENLIIEKAKKMEDRIKHVDKHLAELFDYRIVFAHGKNLLGETLYRFKGEFKLNREKSNHQDGLVWERISDNVETYPRIFTE